MKTPLHRTRDLSPLFVAIALLLFLVHRSEAATWTGGESVWDMDSNWNTMQVPTTDDEVNITNGGTAIVDGDAAAQITYLGRGLGETGSVRVVTDGNFGSVNGIVAGAGTGTSGRFRVEGGGQAQSSGISLGSFAESHGELQVSGDDSLVMVSSIAIGNVGEGEMMIAEGGTVMSGIDNSSIASLGATNGIDTVTITDSGSRWEHVGNMFVGLGGQGSIAVESGGAVTSGFVGIGGAHAGPGLGAKGSGSVKVSGPNSSWVSSGSLQVGGGSSIATSNNGNGSLEIQDGGKFSNASSATLAVETGSIGEIVVEGIGSEWNVGGTDTTRIGIRGKGTLTVRNGGKVTSTGISTELGSDSSGHGVASVSGTGSHWSNTGQISVGILGMADLTVDDGGKITTPRVTILTQQSFVTNSVNLNGSVSTPQSRGIIETGVISFITSSSGTKKLNFNGGILRATANQSDFIQSTGNQSVDIFAGGAFLDSNSFTIGIARSFVGVGGLTKQGAGTLTLSNFASTYQGATTVEQGTLQIAFPNFPLTRNLLPTSTALVVGNSADTGAAAFNLNGYHQEVGSLSSIGATMSRIVTNSSATASTLTVHQSINTTFAGQLTGNLGLTKLGTGSLTLAGANTHSGVTLINSGALVVNGSITGNVTVGNNGTLKGIGSVGAVTVQSGGILSPGQSPGTQNVSGGLVLAAGSTLLIELGGTTPSSQYDQVHVAGDLAVGGTLHVQFLDGFMPQGNQSFDILDWGGNISDTFASINLPTLGGSLTWDTSQLYTAGILRVLSADLPGDYNQNGTVDTADYTLWRNHVANGVPLPNDDTPGIGPVDYTRWKTHFGETSGSGFGAKANATVPEPAALVMFLVGITTALCRRCAVSVVGVAR